MYCRGKLSDHGVFTMRVAFVVLALLLVGCTAGHKSHKDLVVPKGELGPDCSGPHTDYFEDMGGDQLVARSEYQARALVSNMCVSEKDPSKRLTFGVIEFDDEGIHWDRNQFNAVQKAIKSIGRAQAKQYQPLTEGPSVGERPGGVTSSVPGGVRSEGIFLMVFVHGWRHSAAESSTSLRQFRWFASELASSKEICNKGPILEKNGGGGKKAWRDGPCRSRPHVVAVYLGWRGKSTGALGERLVLPELLSFWGRKATALRVAGTPMTETVFGILHALEKADETLAGAHAASGLDALGYVPVRSRSMIVGHSFGARVVEHAFAQALVGSRLESQRASSDRLRKAVANAAGAKSLVDHWKARAEDLKDQFDSARAELLAGRESVENAARTLETARDELEGLVTQAEADVRFVPYRSPSLGTIDAEYCEKFDGGRVKRCVRDAKDVWRVGSCLMNEVTCLYRSYACSIQLGVARRASVMASPSELSEWCETAGASSAEVAESPARETGTGAAGEADGDNEQVPLVVIREGDDLAKWGAFAQSLKESHDALPPAAFEDADEGEVPDWGPAVTYLQQLEQWARSQGVWARIVAFLVDASGGVTKGVRERLLDEMDSARAKSVVLLSPAGHDLKEVQGLADELGRRERARNEVAKLEVELHDAQSHLDTIEDTLDRLRDEIEEAKYALNSSREGLQSASVAVRRLIDSTLRPPADLILLVNPATEAMSARNLMYALCSTEEETMDAISQAQGMLTGESLQILERRPWIVSVTSTGDDATGRYFPRAVRLARFVGGKRNRKFVETPSVCERNLGSYEDMVVRTAGHSERMVSHEVVMRSDGKGDPNPCDMRMALGETEGEALSTSDVLFGTESGAALIRKGSDAQGNSALGRKYWVVAADPRISRDHNDVFNKHTLGLTTGLICHARLFDSLCPEVDEESKMCVGGTAVEVELGRRE